MKHEVQQRPELEIQPSPRQSMNLERANHADAMLERALALWELGFHVFPLGSPRDELTDKLIQRFGSEDEAKRQWPKTPRIAWSEFQTRAPTREEVDNWWTNWPMANIAIVTGIQIDVIDADSDEAVEWCRSGAITRTPWENHTGRGVQFLYRKGELDIRNSANPNTKIDTRGVGGYIVAPGSTHSNGNVYQLVCDEHFDVESPDDLPALTSSDLVALGGFRSQPPAGAYSFSIDTSNVRFGQVDEDGVCEGGRNNKAAQLSGRWIFEGNDAKTVRQKLGVWNQNNSPPLSEEELDRICESVIKTNARNNPTTSLPDVSLSSNESESRWPEPVPLPEDMLPVLPFDTKMLPEAFRSWVADIAHRQQSPIDFAAVGAIASAASLIGRQCRIRPKEKDDWTVVPNLWGACIGRPSTKKTPALGEAMKPLNRLVAEALAEYEEDKKAHNSNVILAKNRLKGVEKELAKYDKDSKKPGASEDSLATKIANLQEIVDKKISARRYVLNDPTVEKVGELLNENSNGLLVFRDELVGWLRTLDREDRASDRAFYLSAWNGDDSYVWDRIGRGTVMIPAACLSVLGGIQPGPLTQYVRAATSDRKGADGLLQRFQLLVWPDQLKNWKNIDQWPDSEAKNKAFETFQYLAVIDTKAIGATFEDEEKKRAYIHFSSEAQSLFNEWYADFFEAKVRQEESGALESHFAKYASLIPSLALIFHLADQRSGPVSAESLKLALRWPDYLESHARRLYAHGTGHEFSEARALALKITTGKLNEQFSVRDVYRNGWVNLNNCDAARRAISILVDHHWLFPVSHQGVGRPSEQFMVNPRVMH